MGWLAQISIILTYVSQIWANEPTHSFLVGCLNLCLQGTSVRVVSPCPGHVPHVEFVLVEMTLTLVALHNSLGAFCGTMYHMRILMH
jgi:hypothetical protein